MASNPPQKYLQRWGESELNCLPTSLTGCFEACIVIPACREPVDKLIQVWTRVSGHSLIILVANSATADDASSLDMLNNLRAASSLLGSREHLEHRMFGQQEVLLVNRISHPIPRAKGVGLARKLGCDIACLLINQQRVQQPVIYTSDADATLPGDYLKATLPYWDKNTAACIFPFRHQPADEPTWLYEISLYYYVLGLRQARSAYAHMSIGSTLALNAHHYALVRGFPARAAGEDFYLLNKLAKTGAIKQLDHAEICLSSRFSDRVGFGTGRGIGQIRQLKSPATDYLFYAPAIFLQLQDFLDKLSTSQNRNHLSAHFDNPLHLEWADSSGLVRHIRNKNSQSARVFLKSVSDWMDGFRTLKFIHFLRDRAHPSQPLQEVMTHPMLGSLKLSSDADPELVRNRFATLLSTGTGSAS